MGGGRSIEDAFDLESDPLLESVEQPPARAEEDRNERDLEHVEDPRASAAEIRRVLRPGGLSVNIFPVYFGALSHHLDYVTTVPGPLGSAGAGGEG